MKNTQTSLLLLAVTLVVLSCKKDPPKDGIQQFWDCNAAQHFDSTKLADKLLGFWKWEKMSSEKITKSADKTVIASFTPNGKFTVTENSVITTQGNWRLKVVDSGILGLSPDTPSPYLHGRILLCEPHVLFNDSYRDGADNYFTRTK